MIEKNFIENVGFEKVSLMVIFVFLQEVLIARVGALISFIFQIISYRVMHSH